jgi:fatty-acyl-CoA synthase
MLPIDFFFRAVRRHAGRIALQSPDESLTYAELGQRVNAFASALQAADPEAGSRVAVCAGNTVDHIVALLGVLAAEKTWVPLNARNATAELDRTLAFTGPTIVVADADHAAKLAIDAATTRVIHTGQAMRELLREHASRRPLQGRVGPDDVQAIKFTGGSTGVPKGVMQPYRAWTAGLISQIHAYGLGPDDRYLVAAPVTHGTSTYVLPVLAQGGRHVLPQDNKPTTLARAFVEHGVTTSFMPPTLIYMLMAEVQHTGQRFPALRHLIYGGAPMPLEKIRAVRDCFGPVLETTYGQTEAPQIVTVMRAEDFEDEANWSSVGRPALLADVGIMNPQGELLPTGEIGEVVVRGDLVMAGYWRQPEKSAETIVDGWLHTGDGGYLDARGYLFLRDRLREVIITGGFNVYPIDVEGVLDAHPAVHESAVFGIEDDKWGEAVHAAVQLKPGETLSESELIAFAKERLGSVKAPKHVHFYDSLPRSVAGKVHKPSLKTQASKQNASE